jgi:hypothetical protein
VCSLSIFRLDFPPGGARLYPLAKLPAESGGRRRGDFCFGYSDLAIGAVGAGGELGGVRSRSWRDRAAQVSTACVLSRFSGWIFRLAARVFIPWRSCPPNPAVGGAAKVGKQGDCINRPFKGCLERVRPTDVYASAIGLCKDSCLIAKERCSVSRLLNDSRWALSCLRGRRVGRLIRWESTYGPAST